MKSESTILMAHSYYRDSAPSGENRSFEDEARLLEQYGHRVVRYTRHNEEISEDSLSGRVVAAATTIWAERSRRELERLIVAHDPSVVHFQNTFPLISPSAYYACRKASPAVVQTLRNYRLLCVNGELFRDNHVCELCVGRSAPWHGIRYKCYRDSHAASAVVTGMIWLHRTIRTWNRMVDVFIAPSEFAKRKLTEAGIPDDKIEIKGNFVDPDPGMGTHAGGYGLFVGRLSEGKGIRTLLESAEIVTRRGIEPVSILGDGPLSNEVKEAAAKGTVRWLGTRDRASVRELMGEASYLVVPSLGYETFGRVVVEAFARGTPVIASRTGAIGEIVREGETGLTFQPGDADGLAKRIIQAVQEPVALQALAMRARKEFENQFSAKSNYSRLADIYSAAIERRSVTRVG